MSDMPAKINEKMKMISIHVAPAMLKMIDELALKYNVSRSEIIRYAIYKFVENPEIKREFEVKVKLVTTGFTVPGLRQLLICENCGHVIAELKFTDGVSVYQKALWLRKIGVRCPKCGSAELSIIVKPVENDGKKAKAKVIENE